MPSRSSSFADPSPTPGSASTFRSRLVELLRSDDEGVVRLAAIHDLHLSARARRAEPRGGRVAPRVVDGGADVQREQTRLAQGLRRGPEPRALVVAVRDERAVEEREVLSLRDALPVDLRVTDRRGDLDRVRV